MIRKGRVCRLECGHGACIRVRNFRNSMLRGRHACIFVPLRDFERCDRIVASEVHRWQIAVVSGDGVGELWIDEETIERQLDSGLLVEL